MKEIYGVHSQANFHRQNVTQTQPISQIGDVERAMNPAKSARAALIDRPDLAGKPFGHLVSLFARGLPLPPNENTGPDELSPETETVNTSGDATSPEI
jgi:hypothetical protein